MSAGFDERIARATELAQGSPAARDLLAFYVEWTRFQKPIFEELSSNEKPGVPDLMRHFPGLLALVRRTGPDPLIDFARRRLRGAEDREELLRTHWERPAAAPGCEESHARLFFARVLLQPLAESLARRGNIDFEAGGPTCPFCDARPAAAVLRGEGDGAKRWLLCSMCSTEWPFRRVLCPACGQGDKDKLPIYAAAGLEHVRVEACDGCRMYVKSVDLTKDGLAIPVVDELATVSLNIWADEHGYAKLQYNLLGL